MFDSENRFLMEDYQNKPTFSSFLPGLAGPMGVPVWCYYNNRGQAVCSFGVQDKDHAIMEFASAHAAYQNVSRTGFRTFLKVNGEYGELFTERCDMHIGMSELEIACRQSGLQASAVYFGVPGERTASLARSLTITNVSDRTMELEILDGMSALVPYGVNEGFLKNMSNLTKAWMQAEDADVGRAYFRVRASLEDGAIVREVKGGNFCLGWSEDGTLLSPIVQPEVVFGQDTSLSIARGFRGGSLSQLPKSPRTASNLFPCCFLPRQKTLQPGESLCIYSLYGQAECKEQVQHLSRRIQPSLWFPKKRQEALSLVQSLCAPIACKTADPVFDAYCRQTYLDNLLRGGTPTFFRYQEKAKPFYLYSRKHGDPEREYNYFSLGREYFAQGNGNYRDVNQNRRCDVLFAPEIGAENIHTFFDLIQTDGYNPLVITPSTFRLSEDAKADILAEYPQAAEILSGEFTPGTVAMAAEDWGMPPQETRNFTARVICAADSEPNADFGEGYWCDHWTYNLDLIESYLAVYPEQKGALLFEDARYRWYETRCLVNPRAKRYCITENGLRQYHALEESAKEVTHKWMQTADGQDARSTLMEKLILLCTIKTATLDAAGMGVEMEGGRPGWYDALNGMPGLLGSSMAESCELARLLAFTADALEHREGSIALFEEISQLLSSVSGILAAEEDPFLRWYQVNRVKEAYREATREGYQGSRQLVCCGELADSLREMEEIVLSGIRKAEAMNGGLIPTYFTFEAEEYTDTAQGPMPTVLAPKALPLFLEGPVRQFKLALGEKEKTALAQKVRQSGLYDRKLHMYKVNESLSEVSYEAGRAKAFTPGWLENESIWLHMEYKYLLELLKNGLFDQFAEAFHDAAVPFQDPKVYGRSPLENSSFIASSANPDPNVHGRGFVSRLSGSTAELIHMWQLMFFGSHPFYLEEEELRLAFTPYIPEYLMPEDGIVETTFLGHIPVVYFAKGLSALVPGKTVPVSYSLAQKDGTVKTVTASVLTEEDALAVRSGDVLRIEVTMWNAGSFEKSKGLIRNSE